MSSVKKENSKQPDPKALFLITLQTRELLKFHQLMGIDGYHSIMLKETKNQPPNQPKTTGKPQNINTKEPEPVREKTGSLARINERVQKCSKCDWQKKTREKTTGKGTSKAKLMIVGDFIHQKGDFSADFMMGKEEDLLLGKMMAAIKLEQEDIFVTNLIKCQPDQQGVDKEHISNCCPHLIDEIKTVQPKIIMAMGEISGQLLCNRQEPLLRIRGRFYPCPFPGLDHIKVMVTLHPVKLKDMEMKKIAWLDLQAVQKVLDNM